MCKLTIETTPEAPTTVEVGTLEPLDVFRSGNGKTYLRRGPTPGSVEEDLSRVPAVDLTDGRSVWFGGNQEVTPVHSATLTVEG